jgi:hypothetical protein
MENSKIQVVRVFAAGELPTACRSRVPSVILYRFSTQSECQPLQQSYAQVAPCLKKHTSNSPKFSLLTFQAVGQLLMKPR